MLVNCKVILWLPSSSGRAGAHSLRRLGHASPRGLPNASPLGSGTPRAPARPPRPCQFAPSANSFQGTRGSACAEPVADSPHSGGPGLGPPARAGKKVRLARTRARGQKEASAPSRTPPHLAPQQSRAIRNPSLEFPARVASWRLVAPLSTASELPPAPRPVPSRRRHTTLGLCQPLHVRGVCLGGGSRPPQSEMPPDTP